MCCLLLAINPILGCDSVSSFSRIGKRKHSRHLKREYDELADMRDFGEFPSISLECSSMVAAIQFVSSLCQNKATSNINELWHAIFTKKNVSGDRLPPTLSRCVNYHTFIGKSSCAPALNLPSPIGNGLQMEGLKFCEEFILNLSVPDAIVELTRYWHLEDKAKRVAKQIHLLANVHI